MMEGACYQLSDYATDYATDLSDYDQFALITASIHYFNASDWAVALRNLQTV